MKLTLNTSSAVQAINYVMPACRKSTLPVLQNILLKPDGDKLKLTASTTEIELTATLDVQWSEQAAITVEGKKLADIFKSLPKNADATITLSGDKLVVKQGRSRFTLKTLPAVDFPEFMPTGDTTELTVSASELHEAMTRCIPAMPNSDARPYLNGMRFTGSDNGLEVVATDGLRLSMCSVSSVEPVTVAYTVPYDAVKPVMALMDSDAITLNVSSNALCAANQGRTVTVKLLDNKFPDYNRVIPRGNETTAEFNLAELISAVGRVKLLSSEKNKGVQFLIQGGECTITGRNADQEQAEEVVPCAMSGAESVEIGFNADYLLDAIGSVKSESVVMQISGPASGVLIEDGAFAAVVMPYRV